MKTNIKRDDFLENNVLTSIKINKKENIAAFIVNKANLKNNSYDNSLWLIYLENNELKKLDIQGSIKKFIWEEDFIVYFILKGNHSIFYKYNINAQSTQEMFSIPMKVGQFIFANNKVFFTSENSYIERVKDVEEGTELPFYSEGVGVVSNNRNSLFLYKISDKSIEKITGEDISITSLTSGEALDKLVFVSSVRDKYIKNESNIYVIDTESEKFQLISSDECLGVSNIAFIDKETIIFAATDLKNYGRNGDHEFYTIDVNTKKQSKITDGFDKNTSNAISTDARFGQSSEFYVYENQAFFLSLEKDGDYFNKINKKGDYEKLSFEAGTIDSFAVLKHGIIFIGLRLQSLQEIYLLKEGKEYELTNYNGWLKENRITLKPEPLKYINKDGLEIEGWVIKPFDYDESKKYPGVLCIHGGPRMIYNSVYSHLMQLLASNGYFVFFCNPRGSSGRGNKFSDIRGNFISPAFMDIMGFTDKVITEYTNIDTSRIGVTGGSYGGYLTNYIISHTNRFAAAVSERGISNLISMFNTSDIGYAYIWDYMGNVDPWNNMETYIKDSPIFFANKVKTPTLFIHGKNDKRCNYTESFQMYSAIKYFGVEAKLCLFEEESHSLETKGKPRNRVKRFDEIIKWFERYLNFNNKQKE